MVALPRECPVCGRDDRHLGGLWHKSWRAPTAPGPLARLFGARPRPSRLRISCLGCEFNQEVPCD